ncbi:MAG: hypothetical protein JW904_07990 [Spirochaetales bacterium]|nr:hypothetical protein [Spirochaetales bacterium]
MHRIGSHNNKEQNLIKKICHAISNGLFSEVHLLIENFGNETVDNPDADTVQAISGTVQIWEEHVASVQTMEPYSASEFLLRQWNKFLKSELKAALPDQVIYSLKSVIFTKTLKGYLELYNMSGIEDFEILSKVGYIYKELGNYDQAIQSLELARQQQKNDPRILMLLADSYAQVDEIRAAKLFFREALFIDPALCMEIECEAAFICTLLDKMREEKIPESLLYFWLPVYATVTGLFNVKRELKPVEIGKLKQSIQVLEQNLPEERHAPQRALLLNRYFWLLDHYEGIQAQKLLKDEILLKMKEIDSFLFERYIH